MLHITSYTFSVRLSHASQTKVLRNQQLVDIISLNVSAIATIKNYHSLWHLQKNISNIHNVSQIVI